MALGALFDNFRILNDGVKAILIVMPFATALGLTALLLHYRLKRAQLGLPSEKEPQPPRDRKEASIHALIERVRQARCERSRVEKDRGL